MLQEAFSTFIHTRGMECHFQRLKRLPAYGAG